MMFSSCTHTHAEREREMRIRRWATRGSRQASRYTAYVLAAVDEFVYGHHAVLVFVHLLLGTEGKMRHVKRLRRGRHSPCARRLTCLEENLHVLTGRLLFEDGVRALAHHVVNGLHDVQHFLRGAETGSGTAGGSPTERDSLAAL